MSNLVKRDSILYIPKAKQLTEDRYIVWHLYPVAVYDYVDVDYSDKQGWLQEEGSDIEMETVVQYIQDESFYSVATEYGFDFIPYEEIGTVYYIDYTTNNPRSIKITLQEAIANALR